MRGQRTLSAVTLLAALAISGIAAMPGAVLGQDEPVAGLTASLDLHGGALPLELPLEAVDGLGFTFIDVDDPRAIVQVINGCSLNDRFWVLAANMTTSPATLMLVADDGRISRTFELPGLLPDGRVDPVVGLSALPICDAFEESGGGIAPLSGTARFSGVGAPCGDVTRDVTLIPHTSSIGFAEVRLDQDSASKVIMSEPVAVLDDSGPGRSLTLFAESRLPGTIEGVSFSGPARLLPDRATLERRLRDITDGRIRRAFEHAVNGGTPRPLMNELGLRQVKCVHHVALDFADPDARDRLFLAGWLKEDPEFVEPATDETDAGSTDERAPVTEAEDGRFLIETIDSEGRLDEIAPRAGPSGRLSSIRTWTFQDEESLGQVIDACSLTGSYWGILGSLTESGFEATFLDVIRNASSSYLVPQALGGSLAPAVVDAAVFTTCE